MVLLLLLGLISIDSIRAQESESLRSHNILIGMNSDAFAGLEIGYVRGSSLGGKPVSMYLKFNMPLLSSCSQMKIDSWELEAGTGLAPIGQDRFILRTDLSLFAIKHTQILGDFFPLGCKLQMTPSVRTKKGYLGFQIRYQQVLCTYVDPSAYVAERFDDIYNRENQLMEMKPKSGFYPFTGSHLCLGVEGMFATSERLSLYADLGMINYLSEFTGTFDSMMFGQIPFYTHIRLKFRLGRE